MTRAQLRPFLKLQHLLALPFGLLVSTALLAGAGCDSDGPDLGIHPGADDGEESDGAAGDTCEGRCAEAYDPARSCQCDAQCESHEDCCEDIAEVCGETCDPTLACAQVLTCVDGQEYPTACGPANCDEPIGPCGQEAACDPTLACLQALTCVDGYLYPTGCGPSNCDQPIGAC